jgi:LmbE family N-acetylglucosaminyl deacetylase
MRRLLGNSFLEALSSPEQSPTPNPQTTESVVVLAHPNDEAIGVGSRLPRLRKARFIYVTDGAPKNLADAHRTGFITREEYALARRNELYSALALGGVSPCRILALGLVDQEASFHLAALSERLAELLADTEIVLTHPYEGGHPDHDATAFAVHAACALLVRRNLRLPTILEMTSYHVREGRMATGEFLWRNGDDVRTVVLSEEEKAWKEQLYGRYVTQRETLRWFPIQVERFRFAPRYDFAKPPHEGDLFYEQFDWSIRGEEWRRLAMKASRTLGL